MIQRAIEGKSAAIPNALELYQTYERGKEVAGDFKTLHKATNATVDQHGNVRTTSNDEQRISDTGASTTGRITGMVRGGPSEEANLLMSGRPRKNWGQIRNINQSRKRKLEQEGGPNNKRQRSGTHPSTSRTTQTNTRSTDAGVQTTEIRRNNASTQTDLNALDTNTWEGFRAYRAGGRQHVQELTRAQRQQIRREWTRDQRKRKSRHPKKTRRNNSTGTSKKTTKKGTKTIK